MTLYTLESRAKILYYLHQQRNYFAHEYIENLRSRTSKNMSIYTLPIRELFDKHENLRLLLEKANTGLQRFKRNRSIANVLGKDIEHHLWNVFGFNSETEIITIYTPHSQYVVMRNNNFINSIHTLIDITLIYLPQDRVMRCGYCEENNTLYIAKYETGELFIEIGDKDIQWT